MKPLLIKIIEAQLDLVESTIYDANTLSAKKKALDAIVKELRNYINKLYRNGFLGLTTAIKRSDAVAKDEANTLIFVTFEKVAEATALILRATELKEKLLIQELNE